MIHVIGNIAISIETQLNQPLTPNANNIATSSPTLDIAGHGALQAISAARCGARVSLISTIGTDLLGEYVLDILRKEGIQTSALSKKSGHRELSITLDAKDQKTYIGVSDEDIFSYKNDIPADYFNARSLVVISNNLDPNDQFLDWLKQIRSNGARVLLCLLPKSTNQSFIPYANIIVRDETMPAISCDEAYLVTTKGCGTKGAKAQKADTIACALDEHGDYGSAISFDIFCGYFAACIQACLPLEHALKIACSAATQSSRLRGAYNAIPYLGYLEDIAKKELSEKINGQSY
jgi:ribokinase